MDLLLVHMDVRRWRKSNYSDLYRISSRDKSWILRWFQCYQISSYHRQNKDIKRLTWQFLWWPIDSSVRTSCITYRQRKHFPSFLAICHCDISAAIHLLLFAIRTVCHIRFHSLHFGHWNRCEPRQNVNFSSVVECWFLHFFPFIKSWLSWMKLFVKYSIRIATLKVWLKFYVNIKSTHIFAQHFFPLQFNIFFLFRHPVFCRILAGKWHCSQLNEMKIKWDNCRDGRVCAYTKNWERKHRKCFVHTNWFDIAFFLLLLFALTVIATQIIAAIIIKVGVVCRQNENVENSFENSPNDD